MRRIVLSGIIGCLLLTLVACADKKVETQEVNHMDVTVESAEYTNQIGKGLYGSGK